MSNLSTSSLREQQHPLIRKLANRIEGVWSDCLTLDPYELPGDLGYVEGRLEGEKLTIENRCYQTPQFRKLHLELAKVGESLDILHCVMFPRVNYALPTFGTDLVGGRAQISAAIADLSPTLPEGVLPQSYRSQLASLPLENFTQPRDIPAWGDIFSEFCLFVRPVNLAEETRFLEIVESYLRVHCQYALAQTPVSPDQQLQILAAQRYYSTQQKRNDKTRRVLEKAFGPEWAENYLNTVLFDYVE
ncbi:MAG: phycocyanobilin:ferredoxin oxidoreductase [Oscillatoriales cyanobacterium RM2_1_1]|nr:phycocyanobilin:ferredoxin oxidoreductase [Oscillatoriales cyanobacterium SM2_3_0]NJO46966.1 phycocyanobilin:ferredoxin oxidoreductase [Oscillatoriales cyanobacterium RM2_1_1]